MSIAAILFGATIIFSVYGGANFYIASRLYQWLNLPFPYISKKIFIALYTFIAASYFFVVITMMLGFIPISSIIKHTLSWIGAYWMGIFVYLLIFTFAADIVVLLGIITRIIPNPIPRSVLFGKGMIVILLTISVVSYGIYNANQVYFVSYDIQLKKNALSDEVSIVLISDLHLGSVNSENNLVKIVQGINSLEPDIVCIVGDIFNDDFSSIRYPDKAMDLFKSIESKYGVYACLGNHDGGNTFNDMILFLEQSNIKLLNDEYALIDDSIVLLGRLDPSPIGGFGDLHRRNTSDILASINTNLPIIVMEHNPATIKQYGQETDLILSGHTHRGQLFPFGFITNAIFVIDYGHYQKDGDSPHVIVTSGAGTWATPMRVNTRNEIVSITLR